MIEPLAAETLGLVFSPASKPQMELLHVFKGHLVEQVIVGFAACIKNRHLMPRLIDWQLLRLIAQFLIDFSARNGALAFA